MKRALKQKYVSLYLEWYDHRIHHGVATVAREAGWHLICPKNLKDNDWMLGDSNSDGCITLLTSPVSRRCFAKLDMPMVNLGLKPVNPCETKVVTDNAAIGRIAARHFLDHGYRDVIAMQHYGLPIFSERLHVLEEVMSEEGGRVTVFTDTPGHVTPKLLEQLRQLAAKRGRSLEELSLAFFAYDDQMAAELISLCLREGLLVPDNMAVVGVDNDNLVNDGLSISLTSIDSDQEGLGIRAATVLRAMMDDPEHNPGGQFIRHPPKGIVERKSTDCYAVNSPLVSRALHWIHENFHRGIQAGDVSKAMGVTQQGLQKAFSMHHVRSPGQEIRYQRVQAAAHLLRTTSARLKAIAEGCGFCAVDTLITNFRETYGTTPGRYRKEAREAAGSYMGVTFPYST